MPDPRSSIFELDWAKSHGLPMPKRTIFEYATREEAERAAEILQFQTGVTASYYGPAIARNMNGTQYVVTYEGANDRSALVIQGLAEAQAEVASTAEPAAAQESVSSLPAPERTLVPI